MGAPPRCPPSVHRPPHALQRTPSQQRSPRLDRGPRVLGDRKGVGHGAIEGGPPALHLLRRRHGGVPGAGGAGTGGREGEGAPLQRRGVFEPAARAAQASRARELAALARHSYKQMCGDWECTSALTGDEWWQGMCWGGWGGTRRRWCGREARGRRGGGGGTGSTGGPWGALAQRIAKDGGGAGLRLAKG